MSRRGIDYLKPFKRIFNISGKTHSGHRHLIAKLGIAFRAHTNRNGSQHRCFDTESFIREIAIHAFARNCHDDIIKADIIEFGNFFSVGMWNRKTCETTLIGDGCIKWCFGRKPVHPFGTATVRIFCRFEQIKSLTT